MPPSTIPAALAIALVALAPLGAAQFGHPLKGQWSGQWEHGRETSRLLLDLHWDGDAITGRINPGSDEASISSVDIDYSDPLAWRVTIEAERTGTTGEPVAITATGTLENLGAYNRVFRGTWSEGGREGPFVLTRN